MLDEIVVKRIDFYAKISKEPDVYFEKFKIWSHPELPDLYFIYLKYQMGKSHTIKMKQLQNYEEIESFVPASGGWIRVSDKFTELQFLEFEKECQIAKFDISNVEITPILGVV